MDRLSSSTFLSRLYINQLGVRMLLARNHTWVRSRIERSGFLSVSSLYLSSLVLHKRKAQNHIQFLCNHFSFRRETKNRGFPYFFHVLSVLLHLSFLTPCTTGRAWLAHLRSSIAEVFFLRSILFHPFCFRDLVFQLYVAPQYLPPASSSHTHLELNPC